MALHQIVVTLGTGATPISTSSILCREVQISMPTTNGTITVGGSTVSATDYGRSILTGAGGVPIVLRATENSINLNSTYIFGTSTQSVYVLYVA